MAAPLNNHADRQFDIVIYGATGFTGAIVASELIKRLATTDLELKWAIAGRNNAKLTKLRSTLQREFTSELQILSRIVPLSNTPSLLSDSKKAAQTRKAQYISSLPMLIADVTDADSLRAMITRTKLIISCVGPFRLFGEMVVKVCSEQGTHYVDICGEPDFMERCAFKYYSFAQSTGALIVSACGFDSIPP